MAAQYQQVQIPISGRLYTTSNIAESSNKSPHSPIIDKPEQTINKCISYQPHCKKILTSMHFLPPEEINAN